jgi:hypothetical protein
MLTANALSVNKRIACFIKTNGYLSYTINLKTAMNIALNFINQSNDLNNSQVVIFQKNVALASGPMGSGHLVHKTISNCTPGSQHPFSLPAVPSVCITAVPENTVHNVNTQHADTELSLYGISSADIVMTGGGPGPNSTPFQFTLQNVKMN